MPRQAKPNELTLLSNTENGITPGPNSSPINLQGVDLSSFGGDFTQAPGSTERRSPPLQHPQSPPLSPRLFDRNGGRSFFGNFNKSKRTQTDLAAKEQESAGRTATREEEAEPSTSSISQVYHLRKAPGSTPELSLVPGAENVGKTSLDGAERPLPDPRPPFQKVPSEDSIISSKKDKSTRNPLVRNKSVRRDSHSKSKPPSKDSFEQPPMTAPLQSDWPGAESRMFGKAKEQARRGKSAERGVPSDSEENLPATTQHKDSKGGFKASGKNALSKAKAGGGSLLSRLGKIGRSGSSNPSSEREREVPDNEYVFKVINLPLVEQTRITRISKQINACRDKTEYWMPSLPWRCIDYLNSKCEYEGLYRVPGSGPQVKRWQRRFDTELDIDILKEETYDVNEIASMLKAWLRELPTEIFPAQRQKDLAAKLEKENPKYKNVGEPAPQLLRDALSELPPFNYYLLFAITCHLSLILNHKDQNRMDLNNLAVCVGPCLNLDRWLFNYLVGDWRNCWRGCNTERAAQEVEKRIALGVPLSERSEADAIRQDIQYETQRLQHNAYLPAADDHAPLDEHAVSSASVSIASKPSSSHNDPKPFGILDSTNREMTKPLTYIPAGAKFNSDGTLGGLGIDLDMWRPSSSTAAESNSTSGNAASSDGTRDHGLPRLGHRRSASDLMNSSTTNGSTPLPTLPLRPGQ